MIQNPLIVFASKLRFPKLFMLTAAVFVVDVLLPDTIPFADEILLGLLAALLATVKKRGVAGRKQKVGS